MTSLNSTTSTSVEETTGTKNEADSNAPLKPLVITVDEELILERANFYRSSYERSFKIMAISLIVNVVLAISLVIFLLNPEEPRYFSTEKGIITPITPINQGLNRESDVINWASKTISHIYTFSHATMKSTIAEAKDDFTDQGYNSYVKAFIASGNDKNIVENKYSVTAVPKETPIITAAQVVDGVFFYEVRYDMIITYENLKGAKTQNAKVQAVLKRVPGYINSSGLQIHSLKIN